jgi:hypothetical protein
MLNISGRQTNNIQSGDFLAAEKNGTAFLSAIERQITTRKNKPSIASS